MSACPPKTYNGVSAPVFECLKQKLAGLGYEITGTSGSISGPFGIKIGFNWDENAGTLFTEVTDKNFLVPCSQIEKALAGAIKDCGGE